ncbi:class I adenylate-forming enzyme family protein [Falsirhodobacter halotolerans]|uniref:class I adenylate-forming enzyme family protein n=1 Tax=Falsirhodobacter halotolerans TaxID=1146892 RepID=UPI001FD20CB4|nr:AMP-binding protein [Falsirhodobacter halotolerans]MCJ8140055.1 AMP-binding protein [Falsirhodobacter halotolerans]
MTNTDTDDGRTLETLLRHGLTTPDATAIICGSQTLSWGQLRWQVLETAGAIAATGGGPDRRVALLGSADAGLVAAYLAVVAAGACAVPLPVSAHPDALTTMLQDCEPDLIFVQDGYQSLLTDGHPGEVVVIGPNGIPTAFTNRGKPLQDAVVPTGDAPFNIIYSSGTTGKAKGIVHSHTMRWRQAARALFGMDAGSTLLLATPLYSNTTLMPMLAALFHGSRVILMPKFDAEGYLDLAEREGVTHTMLVPVQYRRILAVPGFASRDLSSFKLKQSTGAPLPAADKREILDKWPGRFLEVYGLTEGGCTCILDLSAFPEKAHTVGRPAAGNEIRVIDEEGRDQPPGQRGEIIGRAVTMMSGYFRNEEANRAIYWTDADGTVYHRTGDIGMFDDDGFLVLLDRKKDMIISGGFNIYASDLEEKLLGHPDIAEAAVIGIPSAAWGETPLGLVVGRKGARLDPQQVLKWTNSQVGRMQRLSAIEIREDLPRNNAGKLLKQDLRKPYWTADSRADAPPA